MSAKTKAWVAAEKKIGRKAALVPVAFGLGQIMAGVGQVFFAANLLAAVLLPGTAVSHVALDVAGFVVCVLLRAACLHRAEVMGFEMGAAARRRLRSDMFQKLLAAGPNGLRGRHSAELASVAVDRVEAMDGFHSRWIPATDLAVLGPALIGLVALFTDWRSGLILLVAGLLVPVAMAMAGIGAGRAASQQFVAMTRLQVRFLDRIRGISTLVLAGRTADEAAALGKAADELRVRTMRVLRVAFLSSTALDLAAAASLVLIVIRFAGHLGAAPGLVPVALFLLLLVPEFFAPLRSFASVYQDRMAAEAVAEDLVNLPPMPDLIGAVEIRSVAAHGVTLSFEDVSFGWEERAVLEHLSFRVPAGETLLLTGASGAGKSTIIDLILGFIEPTEGKVTFNGIELATVIPAARERMIGWIGQKPVIFGGTIGENIRFARPEASDDEVATAVKLARLSEVIAALPLGLDTPIGEAGFGLSGGQAQRIAIARAFLKDAPLLLLDEPTAHLDPAVEHDVLESLKRLAMGRTVVLASHSVLALEFARDTGARRLDLDAIRHAKLRGVA
ncbi:MAG: thiol reductant ABC exporter subunit CydD [Acidocella sp. 20-61-6]|nr:MAG: thiol reductant ABC exporter subunit CydD [Acidocella sp. 20-61-6]